jgi:ribosome biogenesis GTPase
LPASIEAEIVAAFGRHYEVVLADGNCLSCFPRGKRSPYACGDRVLIEQSSADQGVIVRLLERRSLLYRRDEWREKLIAANATQVVIVVATEPSFSDELISRCIAAAESQGLKVAIVLNKVDVEALLPSARRLLAPFQRLGYPVIELSALRDAGSLTALLSGETTVLVGQSGMGKSTLVNSLVPNANAATREHSAVLDSGKHTTTHTRMYRLEGESRLIDSPGMQVFGLSQLSLGGLEQAFIEMRPMLGRCRFRDCRHATEPGCAVVEAAGRAEIDPRRLDHFRALQRELDADSKLRFGC